MVDKPLLSIRNLSVEVVGSDLVKPLLNKVSFDVLGNSVMALVGGSGSGKTTTGLSILRLLSPALKITSGEIILNGIDLLKCSDEEMIQYRGRDIGMIFQEPLTAFNPLFTLGFQIEEVLLFHTTLNSVQRSKRVEELLDLVGLLDPKRVAKSYPHQLSGGMRQRAMIAQAIVAQPKLIIADEPTSSLDVTLQAKIIKLFQQLQKQLGLTMILITHDLAMAQHIAQQIVVMQAGKVVEVGECEAVLRSPQASYTQALVEACL